MARTRAVYLAFERDTVRNGVFPAHERNQCLRYWNQLNPAQKVQLIPLIDAAVQTHAAVLAAAPPANLAVVAATAGGILGPPPVDIEVFRSTTANIRRRFSALCTAQQAKHGAWTNLENFLRTIPMVIQITLAHVVAQRTAALAGWRQAYVDYDTWRLREKRPPVIREPGPDGRNKVPEHWLFEDQLDKHRQHRVWAEKSAGDIGLQQPGQGRWQPWKQLNAGMSEAWIWLSFDPTTQTIISRVVRKDVSFRKSWEDMSSFAADHNIPNSTIDDIDTRWPLEIQCHDAVSNVPDIAHTVCLREPKSRRWINNYDKSYRIYVNWCARGDLHDLIELYAEANGGAGQALPEPLLWHVAEALAKSGISMQTGSAAAQNGGPQPGPVAGWRPIVHRDIKPANVFLDRAGYYYRCYPGVFLGDFGLATETDENDNRNPEFWQDVGTEGFMAPEMMRYRDRDTAEPLNRFKITDKTNVFGLGMVLYCMVTLQNDPPTTEWLGDGRNDTTYQLWDLAANQPNMAQPNVAHYTPELLQLITECLHWDPADRLTFADVLDEIYQRVDTIDRVPGHPPADAHDRNLRVPGNLPFAGLQQAQLRHMPAHNDVYRVGLARWDPHLPGATAIQQPEVP